MSNAIKGPKILAAVATVAFFIVLIWGGMEFQSNKKLESGFNEEKLKSEKLLSEKLALTKEMEKLKADLSSFKGKNAQLDKFLNEANQKITANEKELKKIKSEKSALTALQKQHAELKGIKEKLDAEVKSLSESVATLKKENANLSGSVASLQSDKKSLTDEINRMKLASMDKIQVDALTKKGQKLTVTAKKTKQILVAFEAPASIQNTISYKIKNPAGNMLTEKNGTITSVFVENPIHIASTAATTGDPLPKKLVNMTYETKEKLVGGTYVIEVFGEDQIYIGSLQVKLR